MGEIDAITSSDVTVTVDLKNAKAGTDKYTVRFKMGEGFEDVGALNSYTVMVTLTNTEVIW